VRDGVNPLIGEIAMEEVWVRVRINRIELNIETTKQSAKLNTHHVIVIPIIILIEKRVLS
jgi:hypothetical protein